MEVKNITQKIEEVEINIHTKLNGVLAKWYKLITKSGIIPAQLIKICLEELPKTERGRHIFYSIGYTEKKLKKEMKENVIEGYTI